MKVGSLVEIYCDNNHEEPIKMQIREGQEGLDQFYVCPKYSEENRKDKEPACINNLSFRDYTEILNVIDKALNESALSGTVLNLKNYKFKVGPKGGFKTDCRVFYHDDNKIKIAVLNHKALKK